jgi:hypothetical protein
MKRTKTNNRFNRVLKIRITKMLKDVKIASKILSVEIEVVEVVVVNTKNVDVVILNEVVEEEAIKNLHTDPKSLLTIWINQKLEERSNLATEGAVVVVKVRANKSSDLNLKLNKIQTSLSGKRRWWPRLENSILRASDESVYCTRYTK